jgi:transposase
MKVSMAYLCLLHLSPEKNRYLNVSFILVDAPLFALRDSLLPDMFELSNFLTYTSIIQNQAELIEEQRQIIEERDQTIDELHKDKEDLNRTIKELREQLGLNSQNSSKPPSSDGPQTSVPKSLRTSSDNEPGGQFGHKGSYLRKLKKADKTVSHAPAACCDCPNRDNCTNYSRIGEIRQEIDAVISFQVINHQSLLFTCPLDGKEKKGEFPDDIKATVQYGKNLQALVVAWNTIGAVSVKRVHEILSSVYNIPLSTGTIHNMVRRCADGLKGSMERIREKILASEVIHCDETGTKVNGQTIWMHVASTSEYTHLTVHEKRGKEGINAGKVLPEYKGIVVHDRWASYWKYDVEHGICGAHLLRDLNWVIDYYQEQMWAPAFKKFLLEMKAAKEKAIEKGHENLSRYYLKKFDRQYDEIIALAYEENPPPIYDEIKPGRKKKGKVLSLIEALDKLKESVCLFAKNFAVSFDNNQAERDFRNVKTKTKVSGGFRSKKGAEDYATIMSYVGTAKKQKINPYKAIRLAIRGTPELIFASGF